MRYTARVVMYDEVRHRHNLDGQCYLKGMIELQWKVWREWIWRAVT